MKLKRDITATVLDVVQGKVRERGPGMVYKDSEVTTVPELGKGFKPMKGYAWISCKGINYEVSDAELQKALTQPKG